ncbi:MAG TPA: hypothetical protein VK990_03305 [Acidimicrobiia bacterium]|nr:hypothetical protein [Acidimicrobiia bacterium]
MKTKDILYAAVGAPVVAVRKVGDKVEDLRSRLSEEATGYGQAAEKAIDKWAVEGEKVVSRISDGKVVDEITAKVDLDQAKEQVSKLRDQLEEMLATWRTSFRPEKAEEKVEAEPAKTPAKKPATRKPAAKTSASKPSAAKTTKPSAAKTTKTSAAKTSQAKAS